MNTHISVVLSFIFFQPVSQEFRQDCPASSIETDYRSHHLRVYDNICYEFFTYKKHNWTSARDDCRDHGGHLVIVYNRGVQNIVQQTLNISEFKGNGVWIGLTGSGQTWTWSSGNLTLPETGYSHWNPHSNLTIIQHQQCVYIENSTSATWNLQECSSTDKNKHYPYICQYDLHNHLQNITSHTTQSSTTHSTTRQTQSVTPSVTVNTTRTPTASTTSTSTTQTTSTLTKTTHSTIRQTQSVAPSVTVNTTLMPKASTASISIKTTHSTRQLPSATPVVILTNATSTTSSSTSIATKPSKSTTNSITIHVPRSTHKPTMSTVATAQTSSTRTTAPSTTATTTTERTSTTNKGTISMTTIFTCGLFNCILDCGIFGYRVGPRGCPICQCLQ